jgi:hypothetical protein
MVNKIEKNLMFKIIYYNFELKEPKKLLNEIFFQDFFGKFNFGHLFLSIFKILKKVLKKKSTQLLRNL